MDFAVIALAQWVERPERAIIVTLALKSIVNMLLPFEPNSELRDLVLWLLLLCIYNFPLKMPLE
jgi:hypothetical protein